MRIDKNSWHARLYLQAYVHDGDWCDPGILPTKRPDGQALEKLRAERSDRVNMTWKELGEWEKRYLAARTEYDAAYDQLVIEATAEHRKAVGEQFLSGRLSLCPYFWKVVSAVLIYTCLVRPWKGFTSLVKRLTNWVVKPVMALAWLLVIFLITKLGMYAIDEAPRYFAEREANKAKAAAREAKEAAENLRIEMMIAKQREVAERELNKRIAAKEKWEAEHAEEIVQYREMKAAREAAWQAEVDAKEAAEFKQNLPAYLKLGFNLLILPMLVFISIVWIFPALGRGFVTLLETPWIVLALIIIKLEKMPWGRSFLQRVDKWMIRREKRRAAWKKAWRETVELISAMLKATKERVCPFLTVVDSNEGEIAKQ